MDRANLSRRRAATISLATLLACVGCHRNGRTPPDPPGGPPGKCVCDGSPIRVGNAPVFRRLDNIGAEKIAGDDWRTVPVHIADIDGDGRLDTSTLMQYAPLQFFRLNVWAYTRANDNWHGVALLDLDGDGRKDLILAPYSDDRGHSGQPIMVFRNVGGGFVPTPPSIFATDNALTGQLQNVEGWHSETIAIADVDGDGAPDVFIPFYHSSAPNRSLLLINHRTYFTEEALHYGLPGPAHPEGAQFVDIDEDIHPDLVIGGHIYLNPGGGRKFDDRTMDTYGIPMSLFSDRDEGLTAVDFDLDGHFDLYLRVPPTDHLLWRATPGGRFVNASDDTGLTKALRGDTFAWGDAWGDFNLDGTPDFIFQRSTDGKTPPRVLINNLGQHFDDVGNGGLPWSDGIAVGDFDNDGLLDVYLSTSRGELWHNETARLPGNHTLAVSPRDDAGHDNQYATSVVVTDTCEPDSQRQAPWKQRLQAGANGVYLALNQYDVQLGVQEGHCYQVDVQFMRDAQLLAPHHSFAYDPKREGGRRVIVQRNHGVTARARLGP